MVGALLAFLLLNQAHASAQQCDTKVTGAEHMIERINKRYDDFFRYRHEQEARDHARERGRGENKELLERHDKALEKARLAYLKERRTPPDHDKEIEAEMLKGQKERKDKLEAARQCYVQKEAQAEAILKRGRQIPENEEFDIED